MLDGAAETKSNNLFTSVIDVRAVFLLADVFVSCISIKDLRLLAISIVNTSDTMLPCSAHQTISLSQELVFSLECLVLIQLIADTFDFLTSFTWHSEVWVLS